MTLVLQGIALNDEPMSQPLIGRFDERGGTLGRAESATFTLPDPERLISRVQAQILFLDDGYWIEHVSAADSTLHDGRPLEAGMRAPLRAGNTLRIGGYTFVVDFEDDALSAERLPARTSIIAPDGAVQAAPGRPANPTERLTVAQPRVPAGGRSSTQRHPIESPSAPRENNELLVSGAPLAQHPADEARWTEPTQFIPLPGTAADLTQPPPEFPEGSGDEGVKDEFDSAPLPVQQIAAQALCAATGPALSDDARWHERTIFFDRPGKAADDAGAPAPRQHPVTAAGSDPRPPADATSVLRDDPLHAAHDDPRMNERTTFLERSDDPVVRDIPPAAPVGTVVLGTAVYGSRPPERTVFLQRPGNPPEPGLSPSAQSAPAHSARSSVAAPPSHTSVLPAGALAGDEALWRAFVEGIGIELPNTLTPEFMKMVGALLKTAIEGTHHLVMLRANDKAEVRAGMTRIQARGNNPIKFAPDAAVALKSLLQPPARGFLAAPLALKETMADLQSHQEATGAGMSSALKAVLDGFDPAVLAANPTTRSMFDAVRPSHRKAQLWDRYLEQYRSLRANAQATFTRLCTEAFRHAYEEARRLSTVPEPGSDPTGSKPGTQAK